jgi:hypothetical protein
MAVACADGSGRYSKPVEWVAINGKLYVKQYSPRMRISPYQVGKLSATQP